MRSERRTDQNDPPQSAARDRWTAPYPEFAYSESRDTSLRRCARAYYYATYGSWRGWEAARGSDAWLAYRCKKSTPLAAALGTVVHEAATRITQAIVTGQPRPSVEKLRREAGDSLNAMWVHSRRGRRAFMARPANLPTQMLQEVLYGQTPRPETLDRLRATLDRTLASLVSCDEIWSLVEGTPRAGVVVPDRFYQFTLRPDGVTVYATPDLLLVPPGKPPVIIDFKSGRVDGVIDQVLTYSVAARDGLQLDVQDGCIGYVVALDAQPEHRIGRFIVTPEEVEDAADRIRENVARMQRYVTDPSTNEPKPIEEFAQTRNVRTCRWCGYRALCWPDLYPVAGQPAATRNIRTLPVLAQG